MYQRVEARLRAEPSSQWRPFWEYGAFVDVRDVATAVRQALTAPVSGHHRMVLCAADIAATEPSLSMTARLAPGVPVSDPAVFLRHPWRALVDCSTAERVIGWRPRYTWSGRG